MDKELTFLINAVKKAGEAIAILQSTAFKINRKANYEIVTEADLLANEIIKTALLDAFPEDGWLSEECLDLQTRLKHKRIWIVDPIDGTKEYANGLPEYAISVALVDGGEPILGVIFNPAVNELYHAVKGAGAWCNGERIVCKSEVSSPLVLLASRSEYQRGEWVSFETKHEVKVIGSIAYKLALIAKGVADATFSLGPKNEWDIAAGVLLVQEANGFATDQYRKPFLFNQETVLVPGIVAGSASVREELFQLIEELR